MNVSILGVTGYTGQLLVHWLALHPVFKLKHFYSVSPQSKTSNTIHPLFIDKRIEAFDSNTDLSDTDLLFLAIPHANSYLFLPDCLDRFKHLKCIDLSADFRLKNVEDYKTYYNIDHPSTHYLRQAVYGAPEWNYTAIQNARLVANPGCYAIASILGLMPLKKLLKKDPKLNIVIDAKSGVSGAGKKATELTHYCEVNEALQAYNTNTHRHIAEIKQELNLNTVVFSPHLIPMQQGIMCSIYISNELSLTQDELLSMYTNFYKQSAFVKVTDHQRPSTAWVKNSNVCFIVPKRINNHFVIFSIIDNLIKGASGLAIQNANIMFGLDETLGLDSRPTI